MLSLSAKRKERAGHRVGGKNFLADEVAGGSKIWPNDKKYLVWPESSTIFYFKQKQKSYVTLKLVNSEFVKNMVVPKRTIP